MADQYDVTEGKCPEDCPDVEVVTYCINELQQVQNISRVNVKKCCPEDCPCDGEYNSEGCTLCGKCDGHPGFDLPKTFCVADTQPAQNVRRVNVNKTNIGVQSTKDILHADLLVLINNNELIPSSSYRITDYATTTIQANTTSAGNNFDIIVTALSKNELSEDAKCIRKDGDTYFANANLEAWDIKYCIDNDTSRFAWAKVVNGKGVIYYMKDEWGNECPYDFKNIQFLKSSLFLYTFGGTTDGSLTGGCHHNTMKDYTESSVLRLNFNTFGIVCYSNTFGNNCYSNTFSAGCYFNTFGDNCYSNTFGANSQYNTFGNNFQSNTFGIGCYSNTFGDNFQSNTFGANCRTNTFGNNCQYNTSGKDFVSNTFGNYCSYNNFYTGTSGTTKKNYIKYIVLEDACRYNNFYSALTTSGTSYLQRIRIKGLSHTTVTNIQITLSEVNTDYEWLIYYTTYGVLKQLSPDYSLINNYTYKIEDTIVSTWTASTAYAGYDYQAQINIPNLTESDIVSVIFDGVEAISGNYYPIIQIYEGYILIFSKVNATITIPTIEITKIDL